MRRLLILMAVVLIALIAVPAIAATDPAEYRMSWVYGFNSEFATPSATTTTVNTLANNNFNVIVPEIRKNGDAYYNSSYEPLASDVSAGYDPLADILTKAHAKNMQVFGWIVTYRIWGKGLTAPPTHIWTLHPEWALIDNTGKNYVGSYHNLDPGVPGVENYIVGIVKDVVTRYPTLDGFNFDYIRYDSTAVGYNTISKARFHAEYGVDPPTSTASPYWANWSTWKRKQVTDLVKRCYLEAIYINPQIKMSTDTIGWMGGNPNTDFTGTRCYSEVCQDHKKWMEDGIIDLDILMNYKRDWTGLLLPPTYSYKGYAFGNQQADHRNWSDWLSSIQTTTGRHTIDGIGGYMNILPGILAQWGYSRAHGVGLGMYRYGFGVGMEDTAAPGMPVFNTGTNVVKAGSETTYYSTVKAQMFKNPAPVPDMLWKTSPTKGYIFGQVTDPAVNPATDPAFQNWIYQGTVTLTGPYPSTATQTTSTDATGTYGFLGVEPGEYSVSFSKTGYSPITGISASVTVGLATKLDVQLVAPLAPDSYKTLAQANDPALVDGVIGLNGNMVTTPTGTFSDCSYIENSGRSSGLQVRFRGATPTLTEGDSVNLIGTITTIGNQRVLNNATLQGRSSGAALRTLSSTARDLNGFPQTTGLLVTGFGNVTYKGADYFYINDGSAVNDGSGHLGVKVLATGLSMPSTGYAKVTGISTCEKIGGLLYQRIRVRKQADIAVY